jgi:hypothetical protein
MKKFTTVLLGTIMLAGLVLFPGCEKIKSLADVHFDTDLIADLNILIPGESKKSLSAENYSFSESVTVDPREDPDIDKYFDKLKGYDVQEVTATVKSISGGPVTIITGTLTVTSSDGKASWSVSEFVVQQGASLTFGNEEGQWDTINKILNGKKKFTVSITGVADKPGVSFLLSVDISVKVTANPLD